jgi:hypothetical protein
LTRRAASAPEAIAVRLPAAPIAPVAVPLGACLAPKKAVDGEAVNYNADDSVSLEGLHHLAT